MIPAQWALVVGFINGQGDYILCDQEDALAAVALWQTHGSGSRIVAIRHDETGEVSAFDLQCVQLMKAMLHVQEAMDAMMAEG